MADKQQEGRDVDSPTNKALRELLAVAGVRVDLPGNTLAAAGLFLTNAVLCLKDVAGTQGRAQAPLRAKWLRNCGERFLRPLIDIVRPKLIICLGEAAYRSVLTAHGLPSRGDFRAAVEGAKPIGLCPGRQALAVYHCSPTVVNTHPRRKQQGTLDWQKRDWQRVAAAVREVSRGPA